MVEFTTDGALVRVEGVGVLIRGPSGAGKSWTALRLMDRGHRLISDEVVRVAVDPGGSLVGRPLEEDPLIEVRGLGVFRASALFDDRTVDSSSIDLIVVLDRFDPMRHAGRVAPETRHTRMLDKDVPEIHVPLPAGADPGLLVEFLVRRFKKGEESTGS